MKNILICGDSFAADWTLKYLGEGWPNRLAKDYNVTNLAQAGCGQYKIYLQLTSVDLDKFDAIIVSHTSPYRVYVKEHPIHKNDPLHGNSDLIYSDIAEHRKDRKDLEPIVSYFENYFDVDHAKFIHSLICEKIELLLSKHKSLHVVNHEWSDLHEFSNMLSFQSLFETNRGSMNHYDEIGNNIIYQKISNWIKTT